MPYGDPPDVSSAQLVGFGNLRALETKQTDRELAVELRSKMEAALNAVIAIMAKGEAAGLRINFAIARDQFGCNRIGDIAIMRLL